MRKQKQSKKRHNKQATKQLLIKQKKHSLKHDIPPVNPVILAAGNTPSEITSRSADIKVQTAGSLTKNTLRRLRRNATTRGVSIDALINEALDSLMSR